MKVKKKVKAAVGKYTFKQLTLRRNDSSCLSQLKLSRNFFWQKKAFVYISPSHFNILSKNLRNMIRTYVYNTTM